MSGRSFARTAAALAVYDAAGAALDVATTANADEVIAAWDAALKGVQEAFAADTADVNPNGVGEWKHFLMEIKFARRCVEHWKKS